MGHARWLRWVIPALLGALLFALASVSPSFPSMRRAVAATTKDAAKKDTNDDAKSGSSDKGKSMSAKDDADKQAADEELPPLDLGTVSTAVGDATTVLDGGVTATRPAGKASATPQPPDSAGALSQYMPPLWTPNSGRFLLKERQEGLSLTAQAERRDSGARRGRATKSSRSGGASRSVSQKPKTTAQVKPAAKPAKSPGSSSKTPPPLQSSPSSPTAGGADAAPQAGQPNLPEGETLVSGASGETLSDYFTKSELDDSSSGSTTANAGMPGAPGGEPSQAVPDLGRAPTGVIRTQGGSPAPAEQPSVGDALAGRAGSGLGRNVVAVSPWRSAAVVLLCLAMLFAAMWAAGKFRGAVPSRSGRSLSVVETITIAPGRQLMIVEVQGEALILGVTAHSINLLDKSPMQVFDEGYSNTVNAIIAREGRASQAEWSQRPVFSTPAAPRLAPPPPRTLSAPPSRISVGELRRARAAVRAYGAHSRRGGVAVIPRGDEATKAELIGRLRDHIERFEG